MFVNIINLCVKKRLVIAGLISLLSLIGFNNLWYPKGIELTFNYQSSRHVDFQVFYASGDDNWSNINSVTQKLDRKKQRAKFFLPTNRVDRIRFSPQNCPTAFNIANIELFNGKDVHKLEMQCENFLTHKIDKFEFVSPAYIRISSKYKVPYVIYKLPLNIETENIRNFSLLNFLLTLCIPFYLVYVISDMYLLKNNQVNTTVSGSRMDNLEFLRIVFTFGVMYAHIAGGLFGMFSAGAQGVEFFFMLSGYLLAYTYKPETSIVNKALRNWIRFTPVVIFSCLCCCGGWKSFYGLFMLQNTGLAFDDLPNRPSWYIAVLFWCSLFYLSLMKCVSGTKRLFIISCIVFVSYLLIVQSGGDRINTILMYIPRGMIRGVASMGAGILLANLFVRVNDGGCNKKPRMLICTAIEVLILSYVIASFFTSEYYIQKYWILKPISHAILLALFIKKEGMISRLLESPVITHISKYCLSVYLMHVALFSNNFWQQEDSVLSIVVAIVLSCIMGVITYYFVEIPGARYLGLFVRKALK